MKYIGFYQQYGEDCSIVKKYEFNCSFTSRSPLFANLQRGFDFGWRSTGCGGYRSKEYKSFFGPSFFHSGIVYSNSTVNMYKAVTRLTSRRFVEGRDNIDQILRRNQLNMVGNRVMRRVKNFQFVEIRKRLDLLTAGFDDHINEVRKCANLPHSKRELRLHALEEIFFKGLGGHGVFMDKVGGKVKKVEFAKPGKYPRLVNDMTCPGSLYAGYLATEIKHAFEGAFNYCQKGRTLRSEYFPTPNVDTLKDAFDRLINPVKDVEFVYYSDDSCVSVRCSDGVYTANVDISSCDSSNGRRVFEILEELCSGRKNLLYVMKGAVEQCRKTLKLVNPHNKKEKIMLKPVDPIEYSGSVLTTCLNNVANCLISQSLFSMFSRKRVWLKEEIPGLISAAAEAVGYIVTCDSCTRPQQIQFLKHSPMLTSFGYVATLNLGVILRCLGQCDYDLPGSGSVVDRAKFFNYELIRSFAHSGDTCVLSALRDRFSECVRPVNYVTTIDYHPKTLGLVKGKISDDQLSCRYDVTAGELSELCDYIRTCSFGDKVMSPALEKIFEKDYGIGKVS